MSSQLFQLGAGRKKGYIKTNYITCEMAALFNRLNGAFT